MLFDYDDENEKSIYEYAKNLESKTFQDIIDEYNESPIKSYNSLHNPLSPTIAEDDGGYLRNENAKGELGNLLEKYYFGYMPNSKQEADFPKVGIELKQTCVNLKKNGEYSAGERLSITNISYEEPVQPDFYKSHVWKKIKRILLVHYLREKTKERLDYQILFVNLFTPPAEDLEIIINDYNKINAKLISGLAHEISESDTLYLGACTKGSTALKSWQPQYYGDNRPAKKRNYCLKRSYMDYILHAYILRKKVPYESIIKNTTDLSQTTFEEYITEKINRNIGITDKELCVQFNQAYNIKNKSLWSNLAFRMLGIKSNRAEEFAKANIIVKSIRLDEDGKMSEHISIPSFKFKEFVKEDWESSFVFEYFSETKFLFVIYKKDGETYKLLGSQLWNMPYIDLNNTVQEGWRKIQDCIKNGVKFEITENSIKNNIPKINDNPIIHIRPHTGKAAYRMHNGYTKGNIKYADELPNGEWMTKHSFWINKAYILSQLKYK